VGCTHIPSNAQAQLLTPVVCTSVQQRVHARSKHSSANYTATMTADTPVYTSAAQDHMNFSATIKVLDTAIGSAHKEYAETQHKLVQLYLNRGYCNQKLNLNRKALKVAPTQHALQRNCLSHKCLLDQLSAHLPRAPGQ
jgi:hypothetical protein